MLDFWIRLALEQRAIERLILQLVVNIADVFRRNGIVAFLDLVRSMRELLLRSCSVRQSIRL